jgi:cellulose synthase/poly-beta-1,6-N-acetylglucosamine synthase-like glycosyltransferase
VEFEQIYAVSHPGRASLNGFGIFGGSNGYWRTSVLRAVRMRTDRLTEDIDSSIRATLAGYRVASDPGLVSLELAPVTLRALWRQRMRWSQGWRQVSQTYLARGLLNGSLSVQQRIGMGVLLGWREIVPWFTPLVMPLLAFEYYSAGVVAVTEPFLLLTLFIITAGPVQTLVAAHKATPSMRGRGWWFLGYALATLVFYSELKNLIMRVAQVKNLCGEHEWRVTPRSVTSTVTVAPTPGNVRDRAAA